MWLLEYASNGIGVVVDTGTLTPVIAALDALLAHEGKRLGKVAVLQHYPRTQLDVNQAVRQVGGNRAVLALLSVNSSGELRDRLHAALEANKEMLTSRSLHVIVDRQNSYSFENIHTWLRLTSLGGMADSLERAMECKLCRDLKTARLVRIDPASFEGSIIARTHPKTPLTKDARDNRELWEICNETGAIGFQEPPDEATSHQRPKGKPMAIHVRFDKLLTSDDLMPNAERKLSQLSKASNLHPADLVLVPHHDRLRPNFDNRLKELTSIIGNAQNVRSFPTEGPWSEELEAAVRRASHICVFSLGLVTGGSLQAALVGIQNARKRARSDYSLYGMVLHARPSNRRRWENLFNSFNKKLYYAWLSFLPDDSPFSEELKFLGMLDDVRLTPEEQRFLQYRRELCAQSGRSFDEEALFWAADKDDTITPHSIFGEQMKAGATFVAVASAMHHARLEHDFPPPDRRAFEMPAIVRSYYDPLILSAIFRWLRADEAWWGDHPAEVESLIHELLNRASPGQLPVLLAELLLALAQGKLPKTVSPLLSCKANILLRELNGNQAAAVRLGLRIAGVCDTPPS